MSKGINSVNVNVLVVALIAAFTILLIDIFFCSTAIAEVSAIQNEPMLKNNNTTNESLMKSLISSKSFIASVIDQLRNSTNKNETNAHLRGIAVMDLTTVLLSHQIIPPKDYILLYDSYPYKIISGHVTAKLPCDTKAESVTKIYVGNIGNATHLVPASVNKIDELSKPGYMCLYQIVISNGTIDKDKTNNVTSNAIADIVLYNPTDFREVLPNTSTIAIGINRVDVLAIL